MSNLNGLTIDELIITYIQPIYDKLGAIEATIGDIPVSEQICVALNSAADKMITQKLSEEINIIKRKVDNLIDLVGDTSVAEQISMAIKNEN